MAKNSFNTSFSLYETERAVLDDFKELCRKQRKSLSYGLSELIHMAVQANKEGKVMTYAKRKELT